MPAKMNPGRQTPHQNRENTMTSNDWQIRPMTRDQMTLAVQWAAEEGWNPGLQDGQAFNASDPEGFLIGLYRGQPVGMVSAVQQGRYLGFMGFYIVRPGFRGQGWGWKLWQAGLERLAGRCVGLDGVVDQQANYRRCGFELAWHNARFEGRRPNELPPTPPAIQRLRVEELDDWLELDARCAGEGHAPLLRAWLSQTDTVALGASGFSGAYAFGAIRPCQTGFKVGPLFAEHPEQARLLLLALLSHLPIGARYQLDVPLCHKAAVILARTMELVPVFETARMYRGGIPALEVNGIYGITSFELG